VLDEFVEIRFELRQPFLSAKRLVVAEESQDHVGRDSLEMIVRTAEPGRPQAQCQFVPRETEVTHDQLVPRKTIEEQRLKIPKMLHSISQRIADDRDLVAGLQRQQRFVSGLDDGLR
jgi:hypothetical protein